MSTEAIQCPKCNGGMVQGFIFDRADGGGRRVINWVEGEPHRLSGLLREYRRKSAFQWVPSVVRCAASWNPMRARNLQPSDKACILRANPPNGMENKLSISGHGSVPGLCT
jgi:hypothetical protein